MRLIRTTLAVAGLTAASPAAGDAAALRFDTLAAELLAKLDDSPEARRQARSADALDQARRAATSTDAFSISTSTKSRLERPLEKADDTREKREQQLVQELRYQPPSSLSMSLGSTHSLLQSANEPVMTQQGLGREDRTLKGHELQFVASYDVLRGGDKGLTRTAMAIEELGVQQRVHSLDGERLALRTRIVSQLATLFAGACKIEHLEAAIALIERTVRTGKTLEQAGAISYKDFLNLVGLESRFRQRLVTQEQQLILLREQFEGYGDAIQAAARRVGEDPTDCNLNLDELLKRARSESLDPATVVPAHPSVKATAAAKRAAELSVRAARLAATPAVSPYIQTDWRPEVDRTPEGGGVAIGLRLDWTIPSGRLPAKERQAAQDLKATTEQLEVARRSSLVELRSLTLNVESQERILVVLQENAKNARLLVQITETQFQTGSVDTLTYTNAYVSLVDSEHALIDVWASIQSSLFQRRELAALKR